MHNIQNNYYLSDRNNNLVSTLTNFGWLTSTQNHYPVTSCLPFYRPSLYGRFGRAETWNNTWSCPVTLLEVGHREQHCLRPGTEATANKQNTTDTYLNCFKRVVVPGIRYISSTWGLLAGIVQYRCGTDNDFQYLTETTKKLRPFQHFNIGQLLRQTNDVNQILLENTVITQVFSTVRRFRLAAFVCRFWFRFDFLEFRARNRLVVYWILGIGLTASRAQPKEVKVKRIGIQSTYPFSSVFNRCQQKRQI